MDGASSASQRATAAILIADGPTSFDDCPMLTWSLGWTATLLLPFFLSSSVALSAMSSLRFVLRPVPEPVWKTSTTTLESCFPCIASVDASPIAEAIFESSFPKEEFAKAASRLIRATDQMTFRGKRVPVSMNTLFAPSTYLMRGCFFRRGFLKASSGLRLAPRPYANLLDEPSELRVVHGVDPQVAQNLFLAHLEPLGFVDCVSVRLDLRGPVDVFEGLVEQVPPVEELLDVDEHMYHIQVKAVYLYRREVFGADADGPGVVV